MDSIDPMAKIDAYIRNVANALDQIDREGIKNEVIDIARAYLKDSMYHLSRGDQFNALATIAYAEGLLDALRILGIAHFNWDKTSDLIRKSQNKVFVAGTFEIIHPGHIAYLRHAWTLGRVVAVIARDSTVKRIKGRDIVIPEDQRLEVVRNIVYVHKARLGYEDDMFRVVEEERPNIILLGPNQPFNEDSLREELRKRGLGNMEVIRFNDYVDCPLCSTTKILKAISNKFSQGNSLP
ncbi:cytidyltransferase [Vulcanisaeta souniana JCM 11219]|nr:cytidyltransferase [Vulcanisaeta souniana JCM 11219]